MTFQQTHNEQGIIKTAETLLRTAQTMTDRAIAVSLRPLPTTTKRRAEKASHVDRPKAFASVGC